MVKDFSQGKIYKITSAIRPDLIYIGSTTRTLEFRMNNHILSRDTASTIIIDLNDAEIKLIHDFPCNSKLELETEEQRVMDTFPVIVNKQRARANIEEKVEYTRKWRLEHKEEVKLHASKSYEKNKEKRKEIIAIYRAEHKEEQKSKKSAKHTCECGIIFNWCSKARHERSKFHLANI